MQLCIEAPSIGLAMRPLVGDWQYLKISASDKGSFEDSHFVQVDVSKYLAFKEGLVGASGTVAFPRAQTLFMCIDARLIDSTCGFGESWVGCIP